MPGDATIVVSYSWAGQQPTGPWWVTARGRVAGHLDKSLPARRLLERLEAIRRASVPLDAPTARPARAGRAGVVREVRHPEPGRVPALTPREQDIVSRIARGLSNAEIAEQLYLSINSVKTYVRTAYRKMGVTTRPQAVAWWFSGDPTARAAASPASTRGPVRADAPAARVGA